MKNFKFLSALALTGMLSTSIIGTSLAATDETSKTLGVYNDLVAGKTVVPFVLASRNDTITKADIETKYVNVVASEPVKTGDEITVDGTRATAIVYGDINNDGKLNVQDVSLAAKASAKNITLDDIQTAAGDVANNDKKINVQDVTKLAKFSAGNATTYVDEPAEEIVQGPKIVSFEVKKDSSNEVITVKLSEPIKSERFIINGKLYSATNLGDNTYKIALTTGTLKKDEQNIFEVTDETGTFSQTKTFIYRGLKTPDSVTIPETSSNSEGAINASNVNNAVVLVRYQTTNLNKVPVTVQIIISDEKGNEISLSKELTGYETDPKIEGVDFSSLSDGNLSIKTIVKDSEGNVIEKATGYATIEKKADSPIVKYTSVKRGEATNATINGLIKTDSTDTVYYLVKESGEVAPSVDDVIKNNKTTTGAVNIDNGVASKSYVAYLAVKTTKGTKSSSVVAVNIPTVDAKILDAVETAKITKLTSENATFVWEYDETKQGLAGYRAILKNDEDKVIAEKKINLGEEKKVDFYAEMKAAGADEYKVVIVALGNGVEYEDSAEAECATTVTIKSVANRINVTSPALNKTELKWNVIDSVDVKDISDYTIEVAKYNPLTSSFEALKTKYNTLSTSYDIKDIVEANGIGEYVFKVTANAKDGLLLVSKSSVEKVETSTVRYYQAEAIKDLAISKVTENTVTLTGTLLPNVYKNATPKYEVYYSINGITYTKASQEVNSFPYTLNESTSGTELTSGTEYYIKVKTTVGSNTTECVSEVVNAKTSAEPSKMDIQVTDQLTLKKYTAPDKANSTPTLNNNEVTYNDGILYIKKNNTVKAYSTEVLGVEDIISVLQQLSENDKIKIDPDKNYRITSLTLTSSNNDTTTYDLSKVDVTASVTITGNAKETSINGKIASLTLSGVTPRFNLSGLTVTGKVTVNSTDAELASVAVDTSLTFGANAKKVTINDVVISSVAKLKDVKVTDKGFDIVGDSSNEVTVDTTKANRDVTLKFITTKQANLTITANADHATSISNYSKGTKLTVKSGKIDLSGLSDLPFGTVDAGSDKDTTVTIVTNGLAEENHPAENVPTDENSIITDSGLKFKTDELGDASYSTTAGSNEITFTIDANKKVTITK